MIEELKFLLDIVKKAEKISNEKFTVKKKDGESDFVTNLDVKIEEFLIKEIKKVYPKFDIVSEEENYSQKVTKNCFIIDPIDGTINFSNNIPFWAIQVACVKNGKTVASVIDMPRLNEIYYADKNGAFLNGKKISSKVVPLEQAEYVIDGTNTLPLYQKMHKYTRHFRRFGAVCMSMAFVATGRTHGAVYRSDKPWDYEPGLFIAKMAGAEIESVPGFHAVAMNKEFLNILKKETAKNVNASNVFILHSLNGDTAKTWGADIKENLATKEIDTFVPNFAIREESSYQNFENILGYYLEHKILNENSIVVCHSIANAYFIRFCKEHNFIPKSYIAVAPSLIYQYPILRNDYLVNIAQQAYLKDDVIKFGKNFKNVYCLHSNESGLVDDEKNQRFLRFVKDFKAKDIYLDGYFHFDGYHRIYKIPELLDLIYTLIKKKFNLA